MEHSPPAKRRFSCRGGEDPRTGLQLIPQHGAQPIETLRFCSFGQAESWHATGGALPAPPGRSLHVLLGLLLGPLLLQVLGRGFLRLFLGILALSHGISSLIQDSRGHWLREIAARTPMRGTLPQRRGITQAPLRRSARRYGRDGRGGPQDAACLPPGLSPSCPGRVGPHQKNPPRNAAASSEMPTILSVA